MDQGLTHSTVTFFNTADRQMVVSWHHVTHLSQDVTWCKDCNKRANDPNHRHGGSWIHFASGKDVHVEEDYIVLSQDFEEFLTNH